MAEIIIMCGGALAWLLGNIWLLFAVLLLMGAKSVFFGPFKDSIRPQHLEDEELVGGNALLEMGTFLAILLGTIVGGIIAGSPIPRVLAPAVIVIALIGYVSSRFIPEAEAPAPEITVDWNPIAQIRDSLEYTRRNHYSGLLSILGVSWFWLMGSVYVTQIPNYLANHLHGGRGVVTLLLASFSTGIGVGAVLCDRLCGHKIEIGRVPFGVLGLSIVAIHLTTLSIPVPLNAFVQYNSPEKRRARILALNNLMNALFMLIPAVVGVTLLTLAAR